MPSQFRYRLLAVDHTHHLPRGEKVLLGRDETCHVQLEDERVSRQHALLDVRQDKVVFRDMGSRNGSFVNGRKVVHPVELADGDRVRISIFDFTFVAMETAGTHPSTLELVYCRGCGAMLNSDVRFCVHCGMAMDKTMSTFCCPTCQSFITPHMNFCTQCGLNLEELMAKDPF